MVFESSKNGFLFKLKHYADTDLTHLKERRLNPDDIGCAFLADVFLEGL